MEIFDFDEQLKIGNVGESHFRRHYSHLKPVKTTDRRFDFRLGDGRTIEIKTDTYLLRDTPNFFMELYGNSDAGQLGGPWRALADGVDLFVYYFVRNSTFFWFDTKVLCAKLDSIIAQGTLKIRTIKNKSWYTQGYAIPRELLMAEVLQQDTF